MHHENVIELSKEDFEKLTESILNPPEPNEHLRKAMKAYKELLEFNLDNK